VVGKIQYGPQGPIIDVIQGASSGLNKKQWLLPQPAARRATPAPSALAGTLLQPLPYASLTLTPPLESVYQPGTLGYYGRRG
jgi:hypothetical protein